MKDLNVIKVSVDEKLNDLKDVHEKPINVTVASVTYVYHQAPQFCHRSISVWTKGAEGQGRPVLIKLQLAYSKIIKDSPV